MDKKIKEVEIEIDYWNYSGNKEHLVILIVGTGIDAKNLDHKDLLDKLVQIMATTLYAKAHGIPAKNIQYKDDD